MPEAIDFKTKPAIALGQIRQAVADGMPQGVVLADAGYGADMKFQAALLDLELSYVLGVQPTMSWPEGQMPLPPTGQQVFAALGRSPSDLLRSWLCHCQDLIGRHLARGHEGRSRITFCCHASAPPIGTISAKSPGRSSLLIEWPEDEAATKYWFANLSADIALDQLVHLAKLRWRIERDYLELKRLASATTKAAAGAASITMHVYASPPMAS